jgi:hypothetical protein
MRLFRRLAATVGLLAFVLTGAIAAISSGTWRRLPAAPIAPGPGAVAVWTGSQLLVFGRAHPRPPWSVDVAAAYTPATGTWRRLRPLPGPTGNYEGRYRAVWTGREMLVFGPFDFQVFDPRTNHWRRLTARGDRGAGGLVVWTGRAMIDWGGGCCGDASNTGSAYDPDTGAWRTIARSPLAPSQRPVGAWTGRELIVLVDGLDPDGQPYAARFARAAAYDPRRDIWRRIPRPPVLTSDATAVWDGRELLLVGRAGLAYNPGTNRWRRIAPVRPARTGFAAVWAGARLLVWGGTAVLGTSYDPTVNRWTALPRAPIGARLEPAAVWTGRTMIVWGGWRPPFRGVPDGASFSP